MSLDAKEQYLLELINRARLNPAAEAARYNLNLNDGLEGGTIGTSAVQVLSPNSQLEAAATAHSSWMLKNDIFSHTGVNGSNAGSRMQENGYTFQGSWAWRENLAWVGTTGSVDQEAAILQHHEGLYRSENHRVSTFAADMSEIGVGQAKGQFNYNGITYNSSMLTENFAKSGTDVFVTGVAFRDRDGDGFYSIGEGRGDVWIQANGTRAKTAEAGGYGISVTADDTAVVKIGVGSNTLGILEVDLTEGNVKVDLMTNANGNQWLLLSASADLGSGLRQARLLGNADLDLKGSKADNYLIGNLGDNLIRGYGGNDHLSGNNGHDILHGNTGRDLLYGGNGNDRLLGGNQNDLLQGNNGNDKLIGGQGGDTLQGGGGKDYLKGNKGNDILHGNTGRDKLYGGDGDDRLLGGGHNDILHGNDGNDELTGGLGADTFVFNSGHDRVTDFQDNIDTIAVHHDFGVDGPLTVADVLDIGEIRNGSAIFDFGGDDVLTVLNVYNLDMLANDLIII
jgi:hypothetical protein